MIFPSLIPAFIPIEHGIRLVDMPMVLKLYVAVQERYIYPG